MYLVILCYKRLMLWEMGISWSEPAVGNFLNKCYWLTSTSKMMC